MSLDASLPPVIPAGYRLSDQRGRLQIGHEKVTIATGQQASAWCGINKRLYLEGVQWNATFMPRALAVNMQTYVKSIACLYLFPRIDNADQKLLTDTGYVMGAAVYSPDVGLGAGGGKATPEMDFFGRLINGALYETNSGGVGADSPGGSTWPTVLAQTLQGMYIDTGAALPNGITAMSKTDEWIPLGILADKGQLLATRLDCAESAASAATYTAEIQAVISYRRVIPIKGE